MAVTEPTTEAIETTPDPVPADADAKAAGDGAADAEHVVEELLVEEISIDGMCGVY